MRRKAHVGGFTLTELLTTLSIAALLGMMGAPALSSLLARVRVSSAEAKIAGTLRRARSAAVMRNIRVLVCPSDDGRHCSPGYDWRHGWIVTPDVDGNGEADTNAAPFTVFPTMPPNIRVITSAGRTHVVFHPDGNAAGSNMRFTICHARQKQGRSVVISNSGRVRTTISEPDRLQQCLAGIP